MKYIYTILLLLCCLTISAKGSPKKIEYHVSVNAQSGGDGSVSKPFKTIGEAANVAQAGDVITVHEGTYGERVAPPRGGLSDRQRITYQAAKGERVVITGSEPVKGWEKVKNDTWKLTVPNTFFGNSNPFDEQIYGSWYRGKGRPNHTGSVYLDGQRIRETFSLSDVLEPTGKQSFWYAEADGNGGDVLMNFEWIEPANGKRITSMEASVDGGDQAICIAMVNRWPFGYLKDNSKLYFDDVDFGAGTDTLFYQVATLAKGGIIEMYLDSSGGELLGSSMVTNTGDWEQFQTFSLQMRRKLSGKHNICFVLKAPAFKVDGTTTIWAQFANGIDPNTENVEIAVRPQVFYPNVVGIDYITVRGFILENAATNWAPPSAEQPGLIGPRWAKGWIIEENIIRNSRCTGISLGRSTFGHAHHYQKMPPQIYPEQNGGQTVEQLADYFENASWTKDEAGFHIVRNNEIYDCGQAGIVGCSGAAFSLIENNEIHDICINDTFEGDEMAGIKLHFANDAILKKNHIYRTIRGLWLDWGSPGVQVLGNLFHDNGYQEDVFIEVCQGPILFTNNILLSEQSLNVSSQGVAGVHNLITGRVFGGKDRAGGGRFSYYYTPHETQSLGKAPNLGGDWQWYNNLLTQRETFGEWDAPELPIKYEGNILTAPKIELTEKEDGWYLSMDLKEGWDKGEVRRQINTSILGKALVPNQTYTNPDGSSITINTDFLGNKRKKKNLSAGAIEITKAGKQEWRVWNK